MPRKSVRVRKARRAGKMACGHYVLIGQRIMSKNGGRWFCVECALKQLRRENGP
jgi:hypothetical protein